MRGEPCWLRQSASQCGPEKDSPSVVIRRSGSDRKNPQFGGSGRNPPPEPPTGRDRLVQMWLKLRFQSFTRPAPRARRISSSPLTPEWVQLLEPVKTSDEERSRP